MKIETACIHAARDKTNSTGAAHPVGAIAVPIYQTATFAHPCVGQSTGYDYSRTQNPTREHAEKLICALEGGAGACAFATGMAAIATLMELFSPGDEIIATDDLYGGSIRLFNEVSRKNGLVIKYVDTSNLTTGSASNQAGLQNVKDAITNSTKAIFIETPTNPLLKVSDIAGIKSIIGNRDILLIADNTFLTPYFCNPIKLGADIVVHSGTKYLSGHNDTLAGFLVAKSPEIAERLSFLSNTIGAVLSPFDAFLVTRGVKTLALRMEKAQTNAKEIAGWLKKQSAVTEVFYPGFGAMLSFKVDSEEKAREILNKVDLILFAESLGGVETLITYPLTQTHNYVPEAERLARGIDGRLLRLSVGIEAVEDLICDLGRAIIGSRE